MCFVIDETKPIIISASESFDPDFPQDALVFAWYCTSGNCYSCSELFPAVKFTFLLLVSYVWHFNDVVANFPTNFC